MVYNCFILSSTVPSITIKVFFQSVCRTKRSILTNFVRKSEWVKAFLSHLFITADLKWVLGNITRVQGTLSLISLGSDIFYCTNYIVVVPKSSFVSHTIIQLIKKKISPTKTCIFPTKTCFLLHFWSIMAITSPQYSHYYLISLGISSYRQIAQCTIFAQLL